MCKLIVRSIKKRGKAPPQQPQEVVKTEIVFIPFSKSLTGIVGTIHVVQVI